MKQKIVLATGNKGKVKEMADVLADFGFEVVAQTDLGIESPEETGLTFVENAILKARYASEKSGLPAIADDSGLVVDALNGAPDCILHVMPVWMVTKLMRKTEKNYSQN